MSVISKEEIIIDNDFFKASRTISKDEDKILIEHGLSFRQDHEKTIRELERLYQIEQKYITLTR